MTAKLHWLCRRGIKELDLLLEYYLTQHYPSASAAEQNAFERLLAYQDSEILDLIFHHKEDEDGDIRNLIRHLRQQKLV
ncbi:succinate dehydrogenase assembly factor 2 [Dichelobacter nodosus]|uniref:FAD assembly factor SdhE n=1 Tax=Dichelobacter nodosus (strain VCS1703A) TaxID=246195 RepID=A5EVM1_DICNV|nr:succinate dehydrogenase assembly factor 2 [Dichelobacter nodosus]ABQ13279.1 conserved hypothetical protein [Dichelobacter nodosus VCS1703A]AXM45404.1 hypothetical protein DYQ38_02585 [Dichelobacter nodosus]KNZ39422.1 hypothetical protein AKG33_04255 [Dichelobacter nodosus]TGA64983.1 hypothetical protein E5E99_03720 [Dichelobacter nodosus]